MFGCFSSQICEIDGEMLLLLLLFSIYTNVLSTAYHHYDYNDEDEIAKKPRIPSLEDIEFEPIINLEDDKEKTIFGKNINCEEFAQYALNCSMSSAKIFNSTRKSPPMPAKMFDWCTAIRHLTNCAVDWNSECKDVTESHYNEESIKGHMHVVNNICDDEWFLSHYDELPTCIDRVAYMWEDCYIDFKATVDNQKNTSQEWTHYETHFQLCCARTQFRRCTLQALFMTPASKCPHEQAVILQKFSVIVSEGDVFQECDRNIMYENCPGGDPRPPGDVLSKLMNAEDDVRFSRATAPLKSDLCVLFFCIMNLFL